MEFTGLNPVIYLVKTWESTDGSASGVLRHSFIATPENDNATSRVDLMITADSTSGFASGQNQYIDTSLSGWNYAVSQRGVGDLIPGVDIQIFLSGGWGFINGYIIQPGEVFTHRFQPTITVQAGATSQIAGQLFTDELTVTADITMDATYLGKVVKGASASATVLNFTLPASASAANMKQVRIMSEGGAHTMINIKTQGSDVLTCLGQSLTVISESNWGLQDSTISSPTYGLYTNKAKFSSGDGTTTFRLPVLCASGQIGTNVVGGFLRGIDDTVRMPGTMQVDGVGNFKAIIPGKIFQCHYSGLAGEQFIALGAASGGLTPIGNSNVTTGSPIAGADPITGTANNETRPFNTGAYILIRY